MKYEVLIMPNAETEIDLAYEWISNRAPEAAIKWYNGMLDAVVTLETFPTRCPLAPEHEYFDT